MIPKSIDKSIFFLYNVIEGRKMKEKVIKKEEIEELLEKYKIGKKPLSLVLGWGEVTIIRYLDGQEPDLFHSNILLSIKNNYHEFLKYLEKNKELITPIAYKKAYNQVMKLKLEEDQSNIYLIAKYIIAKMEDTTPLVLQKLLYYIEGFSLALLDNKIFSTRCEAWVHGPVYPEIYTRFKEYQYHSIERKEFSEYTTLTSLSQEKVQLIDEVIKNFGCYSGKILEEMTHQTLPWLKAREGVEIKESSNRKILISDMQGFFKEICYQYQISSPKDISRYSKKMFQRIVK